METTITTQQLETTSELSSKLEINTDKFNLVTKENQQLKRENEELKERLMKIELAQLGNNLIISGMQEQPWENYETKKDRVIDTIAAAMGGKDKEEARTQAKKVEISCCSRIGQYKLNKLRPISVTFQCCDDKQRLMKSKCNLPPGVYVNEEFPAHMKRNRDTLRPIL